MKTTARKTLKSLVLILVLVVMSISLISCGMVEELLALSSSLQTSEPDYSEMSPEEFLSEYYARVVSLGYHGSYDEFINAIKGAQGTGIENISVDEDGNLVVWLTDGRAITLDKVSSSAEFISEIRITESKTLLIAFGSGILFESAPLDITFGGDVNGIYINEDKELVVTTIDGTVTNYGKIFKVYFNEDGEFLVNFESGEFLSFGSISVTSSTLACEHEYGEWVMGIAPTCTSMGYKKAVCALCSNEKIEFVEQIGHDYKDSIVVVEPDGAEDGLKITVCRVCGNTKSEFIDGFSLGLSFEKTEREEYRVTGIGTCKDTNIIIPSKHEGLPVTEIADRAFYGCEELVSVFIPDTIVKVGDKAFSECEKLEEVRMPDSVETGTDVFRGSIQVEIVVRHPLTYVPAKDATCSEAGNIAHYWCEVCELAYEDKDGLVRIYDIEIPASHEFEDGVCVNCGKIQDEILIVAIDPVRHLGKFALGTLSNAIGAPEYINVYTADGYTHTLPVQWNFSTYDKTAAGDYTIVGTIQSGMFQYEAGLSNKIEAELSIVEYMKGTADIVFILDISGSMGDEIANVKNNIQAVAQAIEDLGVSTNWAAVTYSDYADCPGDSKEDTQFVMNGANYWFTDTSDYKEAIGSIELAYGGDEAEVAVDALLLPYYNLETRKDARVFYILLTDATYKIDNHYSCSDMLKAATLLSDKSINTSLITTTGLYYDYSDLQMTGGIQADIYSDFSEDLINELAPIILGEVLD